MRQTTGERHLRLAQGRWHQPNFATGRTATVNARPGGNASGPLVSQRLNFFIPHWTPVFVSAIFGLVSLLLQGRSVGPAELGQIRQLLVDHPDWSRRRLSQVLCEAWNWRNAAGQLKDMSSRTLLVKLQQHGHLQLPARRQNPVNRMRATQPAVGPWDTSSQSGPLSQLAPLQVSEVSRDPGPRR